MEVELEKTAKPFVGAAVGAFDTTLDGAKRRKLPSLAATTASSSSSSSSHGTSAAMELESEPHQQLVRPPFLSDLVRIPVCSAFPALPMGPPPASVATKTQAR